MLCEYGPRSQKYKGVSVRSMHVLETTAQGGPSELIHFKILSLLSKQIW